MIMPFAFGDTYGGVANNLLAQQGQNDSNYFNYARMVQAQDQQDIQNQLQQQQAAQQGADAANKWRWQQGQDLESLGLQKAAQSLAERKFDFSKSLETPTGFKEKQAAESKAEAERLAGILAGHLNAKQELDGQVMSLEDLAAMYPQAKKDASMWKWPSRDEQALAALKPKFPQGFDVVPGAGDLPTQAAMAERRIKSKRDTLDFIIESAMKQGGMDLVTQDKSGKWVPSVGKVADVSAPAKSAYVVGQRYKGGLIYLGGDPNSEDSWRKAE